ncbi:MAG: enoyl-CoA hydratase/isomerase family protein [Chloroflexi bacterium]|nr:enoyl-CoA hydratase/isomerase family protein [Chloroflexota bacterium]
MAYQNIIYTTEQHIATITMNRPQRLNAVNEDMTMEMETAIADADKDDDVRVLILTGAGRAFCAGADFRYHDVSTGKVSTQLAEDFRPTLEGIFHGNLSHPLAKTVFSLQRAQKPTLAVVNGDAVGLGFVLALACDLRIGSSKSRFCEGYGRIAMNAISGGPWLLTRVVGLGRALEFLMLSDFYQGEDAYRFGLLNRLVAPENLESEAHALAARLAAGPPVALRLSKRQAYRALEVNLESALDFDYSCAGAALRTEDHMEGIKAMAEKRTPVYKGK